MSVGERLVGALASTWRAIRDQEPELPEQVVFTVRASGPGRRRIVKDGYSTACSWVRLAADSAGSAGDRGSQVREVDIDKEVLRLGATSSLGTLLHDAAHALAEVRGVPDTSDGGRYHNLRFAGIARGLGLDVVENGRRAGWNRISVPEATVELYAPQVAILDAAIAMYRPDDANGSSSLGDDSPAGVPLPAACGCGRPLLIARDVLELGGIVCQLCHQPFTLGA